MNASNFNGRYSIMFLELNVNLVEKWRIIVSFKGRGDEQLAKFIKHLPWADN